MYIKAYACLAIWLIGTLAFFGHELWIRWKHPYQWKHRQASVIMPDWQVWVTMLLWPLVFAAAGLFAAVVYISTNVTVLFAEWRRSRRQKKG